VLLERGLRINKADERKCARRIAERLIRLFGRHAAARSGAALLAGVIHARVERSAAIGPRSTT